jgi:endoglycosylceramidase
MSSAMSGRGRLRRVTVALIVVAALVLVAAACRPRGQLPAGPGIAGQVAPLGRSGRWFTDATGRVVLLHGVNDVEKAAPYYPAAYGFGDDDASFLASQGFTVLRLGVPFVGVMPEPGQIDEQYIDNIASTVQVLARHHIFVVLDFHQDGFSPLFNGNGFPNWMAITDGLPNPPDAVFPLYYVQNPAMQRAFDHFWANSPGPGGVGLQDWFFRGFSAVVRHFAGSPWVLGYEPINEPWPGTNWTPCASATGCPDLEAQLLRPFYERATDVVRQYDPRQLVLSEPFVLFNFGQGPTTIPGFPSAQNVLSFHSYALDATSETNVVSFAVQAGESQQVPILATEFGATLDVPTLDRLTGEMDRGIAPWIEWSYDGLVKDTEAPAGYDNMLSPAAFTALVRPYPLAVAGTPTSLSFDPGGDVFDFSYSTNRPDGRRSGFGLLTSVSVPEVRYPSGYTVTVSGATVVSRPCERTLLLRNTLGASDVSVHLTPGGACR